MAKDFNAGNDIKTDNSSFAKAADIAPPPPDYTHMTNFNNDFADYCNAPDHVNVDGNLEDIDLNQYRNREIEEGMGPGPENDVKQPRESEFGDNCDPPKNTDFGGDLASDTGVDLNTGDKKEQEGKVNEQGIGLNDSNEDDPHSGQRIVDVAPSNHVNQQLADQYTGDEDFKSPYTPDTMVFVTELDKPTTFTQAHDGENPKENGRYYVTPNDIQGMNADEYKDNFAMPGNPTHISDYELGEGTKLMVGETNRQEGWGEGGGKQYYTDESDNKDLVNTRPLPKG